MTKKYKLIIDGNYELSTYKHDDGSFITNTPLSKKEFRVVELCKDLAVLTFPINKLKITIEDIESNGKKIE